MDTQDMEGGEQADITCLPDPSQEQHAGAPTVSLRAPRSLPDTGLPTVFVARLVLKSTLLHGKSSFGMLSERHLLTIGALEDVLTFLVREHLVEITQRGASDIDVEFRLTDAGRTLAFDEMSRCSYCGPAPVTFDSYMEVVRAYSVRWLRITQADVNSAFDGVVVKKGLLDAAAAALNAGKPLLLHGPAGSGKTFIAERLGELLHGNVPIPHAVYVGGEIVQVLDPLVHEVMTEDGQTSPGDKRWRMCKRPMVISGGELTLDALDLRQPTGSGFYQAPPHMKANMGLYIVDDLGRQRIAPKDLLNRWLMPLDRGVDLLTLQSGARFIVPFDVWTVFSSNLDPTQLGDEAFLRRLGSKLYVGPMALDDYRSLFESRCAAMGFTGVHKAFDYLLHNLHMPSGKPFLACYPGDLLALVRAAAHYHGHSRDVSEEGLLEAWRNYFGIQSDLDSPGPPASERPGRTPATR